MHRPDFMGIFLRPALAALALTLATSAAPADDWPQWLGPQRDGVWRETGIVEKFPDGGPKVLWRAPVGMGYAGPAVVGGRVYLTDRVLAEGAANPSGGAVFGRNLVKGSERVLCLDAATGKTLWKHDYDCPYQVSYPAGPRTTPVVAGGKVYTLGTMGDLLCLDADTGKVLWSKNFPKEFQAPVSTWGFSSNPLLDGDKLICLVGAPGGLVIAFHKDTGKELWRALDGKEPGYCPPMVYEAGGRRQLVIAHPAAIEALDPETGKGYWSRPCKIGAGMTIPIPRQSGDRLLLSTFYNGSVMLELDKDKPGFRELWKGKWFDSPRNQVSEMPNRTDTLHAVMCTPVFKDGHIYGVCSYGELRCLDAGTGKRIWMTLQATGDKKEPEERWGNAFIVAHDDRYFIANEKGDLIIARLSPTGYEEVSRTHLLEPTNRMALGRPVVWSHPAFANKCLFARNDKEIVCVSLVAE